MANEIKDLLDDITNDVDNSYSPEGTDNGATFDSGKFRERLSLYVLKDIVCAMLNENPEDVDQMVDNSIMKHIRDNYDGSCYGYLCHARDRLASPEMNVFGNIVQEIDRKTSCACEAVCRTKQVQEGATNDIKEMLDGVENYEQLREKLKKEVSEDVVNDVVTVITKSAEAPTFTKLDEKVKVVNNNESPINPEGTNDVSPEDDLTTESFILKRIGKIITEGAIAGESISQEEAYDTAIVEYAIAQMDIMTKARPRFLQKFM